MSGGGLIVHANFVQDPDDASSGRYVLDKTWQEIYEAYLHGKSAILVFVHPDLPDQVEIYNDGACSVEDTQYAVWWNQGAYDYAASNKNDYPSGNN